MFLGVNGYYNVDTISGKLDLFAETDIVDIRLLEQLIMMHYATKVADFKHHYDLYRGKHPILLKTVTDANKPNNKIVDDFYGHIIDTTVGYFLGKPITVTAEDEAVNEELDKIFYENDKDDMFMEVGKEMCIKGISSVLVYQNEQGDTKMMRVPAEEVIFVYNSADTTEVKYAVRIYEVVTADQQRTIKHLEVYDAEKITYWVEDENGFVIDTNKEPVAHIFGYVPIVPFPNNEEEMSDIAKIETLVDNFDSVLSLASDEHEAYRNAYLMIKNMTMGSDTLTKLKEQGIIEVMEDGDVKFVTKDIQSHALESHLDRLKDNIYRFSQVPDLTDEKFGGNLSGVAIKFKLFGLETKCVIKERKMTKGIKRLLKLLTVPISVKTGKKIELSSIDIQFVRNVPNNLTEITDMVVKLNGIVDTETLLSLLPFVDNPQEIIDKLKEEKDIYAQEMQQYMPQNSPNATMMDAKGKDNMMNKETGNTAGIDRAVSPNPNPTV